MVANPDSHGSALFWKLDPDPHDSEKLNLDPDRHISQDSVAFEAQKKNKVVEDSGRSQ